MNELRPFSVLVIDDSPLEVRLMIDCLSNDYDVYFALDGYEGMQVAKRELPNLILLDIYMEGLDGYDVCRRLKSGPETSKIPLIFITGSLEEEDHVQALDMGAVDFINKPISTPILKQRVALHLRLRRIIDDCVKENAARAKAEIALQEKVREMETFIDNLPHMAWLKDAQSRFIIVNQAFAEAAEADTRDFRGRTCQDFFSDECAQVYDYGDTNVIEEKKPFAVEQRFVNKDDHEVFLEIRKAPILSEMHEVIGTVGIAIDITRQKQLALTLQETQRMEAIGTLAGGIAHDFNNLMMGIQGRASLMADEENLPQGIQDNLNAIEEYVRSATNLTNQLLGFARGGKYEIKAVDLNEIALASVSMFNRTHKQVTIHKKLTTSPLVIEGDQRQIEQVLLNLFINAQQAMPTGGQLFLESSVVNLDEDFCAPYQIAHGTYTKLAITDTGVGMDETVRQQIFDPFFTTKTTGRGYGLGLSSAYTIIKNHKGLMTVESEVGQGTTFYIFLPKSEKCAYKATRVESVRHAGSETVLLVDDENMIIDVGGAMLQKLGYKVLVANGCEKAINTIVEMGDEIDLVILDMIMPDIDGEVTFDRIREVQPQMPVILSSGYAIDDRTRSILSRGCNGFIQKPFSLKELSQKIRDVLEEAFKI